MKKLITLLAALIVCAGAVFAADPVEDYWISWDEKTNKATGGWSFYVKDNTLYGEMLSAADSTAETKATGCKGLKPIKGFPKAGNPEDMLLLGTPWIFGLKKDKPGYWSGGNVVDPGEGKVYKCKVTYHEAKGSDPAWLEMRGEIGLGIGRSQHWKHATKEEASSIK